METLTTDGKEVSQEIEEEHHGDENEEDYTDNDADGRRSPGKATAGLGRRLVDRRRFVGSRLARRHRETQCQVRGELFQRYEVAER